MAHRLYDSTEIAFYCDTAEDKDLIDTSNLEMGATLYIIETEPEEHKLYMLNSSKEWIPQD